MNSFVVVVAIVAVVAVVVVAFEFNDRSIIFHLSRIIMGTIQFSIITKRVMITTSITCCHKTTSKSKTIVDLQQKVM